MRPPAPSSVGIKSQYGVRDPTFWPWTTIVNLRSPQRSFTESAMSLLVKSSKDEGMLNFYRAMHFSAKRGIAIACRLSVRLSVTFVI